MVEDRLILSAEYRLPLLAKTDRPTLQRGLFATAEHLGNLSTLLQVFPAGKDYKEDHGKQ